MKYLGYILVLSWSATFVAVASPQVSAPGACGIGFMALMALLAFIHGAEKRFQ